MNTGRLDKIIRGLERLQIEAQDIFNAYVDEKICNEPRASFGEAKMYYIARPAGSALDYIAALKHVREQLNGR
jgi:hypothetical protein